MPSQTSQPQNTIETVVRLYGNQEDNIKTILQNMNLSQSDLHNVKSVLSILYSKIQKLRGERNQLKTQLQQCQALVIKVRSENDHISSQLQTLQTQMQKLTVQPSPFQLVEYSFDQTPPMKQNYMSMQLCQDKENGPLGLAQIKSSSIQTDNMRYGSQLRSLMRKYNLTPDEFKRVILHYAEEERKILDRLQTDQQKQLYIQGKKSKNYDEWLKKMSKQFSRRSNPTKLTSVSSNYSPKVIY